MLVLSRKRSERIFIGENVELTVLEVRGNRVKLGLTAPPEVSIQREEIRNAMAPGGGDPLKRNQPLTSLWQVASMR